MLITRAPLSTAQRIALRLGLDGDRPGSATTTFATRSSAAGASPAMPVALSSSAAMIPATIVPCPRVSCAVPLDEALRQRDAALEVGMHEVDAGVDHRDPHGRERRRRLPGVVRAVRGRVPLARRQRVGRGERELPARASGSTQATPGTPRERRRGARRPRARAAARGRSTRVARRALDRRAPRRRRRRPARSRRGIARRGSPPATRARRTQTSAPTRARSPHALNRTVSAGPERPSAVSRKTVVASSRIGHGERSVAFGRELPHLDPRARAVTALEDDGVDVAGQPGQAELPARPR